VDINVPRLGKLACNELDGLQDEREGEDKDKFAKTSGSVAGRRLTYDELTGKIAPE
jgi:hypothetical protein